MGAAPVGWRKCLVSLEWLDRLAMLFFGARYFVESFGGRRAARPVARSLAARQRTRPAPLVAAVSKIMQKTVWSGFRQAGRRQADEEQPRSRHLAGVRHLSQGLMGDYETWEAATQLCGIARRALRLSRIST